MTDSIELVPREQGKPYRSLEVKIEYLRLYEALKQLNEELKLIPHSLHRQVWNEEVAIIADKISKAKQALEADLHRPEGTTVELILGRINTLRRNVNLTAKTRHEI